jgi:hypothetical protein
MSATEQSLKQGNARAIWLLVFADVAICTLVIGGFGLSQMSFKEFAESSLLRGLLMAAAGPVAATFLNDLIPPNVKAMIVFGGWTDALPGHRAFSFHANRDPRIDVSSLRKRVKPFPDDPRDQNAAWYRLLLKHKADSSVVDAHKRFLLFRDSAVLTLLIIPAAALAVTISGISARIGGILVASLALQFVWLAVSGRNAGIRLVQNVLAIESAGQVRNR